MDSARAPKLATFPVELTAWILGYLLPEGSVVDDWDAEEYAINPAFISSRRNLSNLCLTCRPLYDLATPYLYQAVVVKNQKELFCLFRTLYEAPKLRDLITCFAWCGMLHEVTPDEHRKVRSAYYSAPGPSSQADHHFRPRLPLTACSAFEGILAFMPKVKRLYTRISPTPMNEAGRETQLFPSEWMAFQRVLSALPSDGEEEMVRIEMLCRRLALPDTLSFPLALRELETITIHFPLYSPAARNRRIIPGRVLQFCPSLKTVQIKGEGLRSSRCLETGWPLVATSEASELAVYGACAPQQFITLGCTVFPALTRLSIHIGRPRDEIRADRVDAMYNCLHFFRRSLDTLCITTYPRKIMFTRVSRSFLKDVLPKMQALKSLTTNIRFLVDEQTKELNIPSLMPPTLEALHLVDDWSSTMRRRMPSFPRARAPPDPQTCLSYSERVDLLLGAFHRDHRNYLPSLKEFQFTSSPIELEVGTWEATWDDVEPLKARFRMLFAADKVDFKFRSVDDWHREIDSSFGNIR
ncbi:uncharacterized protein E0L32_007554 [Thyridium curvatum]|uniref:Uncharacterized protein n=1 Tax=Thyridium curvatum TaxID=1093900 RepID=A0A507AWG3_9PEZI|nr:uncharacterized protein E0L32_007554 [Thyridium curvatum]TPX11817.1 hypothetical protein E0L32_007554 [Thyridium curvatum]